MQGGVSCLGWILPLIALTACVATPPLPPAPPPDEAAATRGKYLFDAANCTGCHTDKAHGGAPLAGGKRIETPFGAYLSRNITPDKAHGIGNWSEADFHRALREGISPSGAHYFAAFPFTSFTRLSNADVADLYAYLVTQPPAATENQPHDVPFPFDVRLSMVPWRALFFDEGPYQADPGHSATWNRGAYLVTAVAHCGECHTPRNLLGAVKPSLAFGGGRLYGSAVETAPNISQDKADGIGRWSASDITTLLSTGALPSGDTVRAPMSEVVDGTKHLTDEDRAAIAEYLQSLPAVPGKGG